MEDSEKHEKTLFTIIMTAAVTAGATICIMNAVNSESKVDQQTIETDKVKIEYFDVEMVTLMCW